MNRPFIIRVVGMPCAGKTLVIRMAMLQLRKRGIASASLDVDRFCKHLVLQQDLISQDDPGQRTEYMRQRIRRALNAMVYFPSSRFMQPSEDAAAKVGSNQAVRQWIKDQEVEVVFLEHRSLLAIDFYPHDDAWLVISPHDWRMSRLSSLHQAMLKKLATATWSPDSILCRLYLQWGKLASRFTTAPYSIYNDAGRNELRLRIAHALARSMAKRQEQNDEDARPTNRPPAP